MLKMIEECSGNWWNDCASLEMTAQAGEVNEETREMTAQTGEMDVKTREVIMQVGEVSKKIVEVIVQVGEVSKKIGGMTAPARKRLRKSGND